MYKRIYRQVALYVILPIFSFSIMSQSGCGNASSDWTNCDFHWWNGSISQFGGCIFPHTCDFNYIRFDPLANSAAQEGTYRATITVTPYTGTAKTWSIYPGSNNNNVLFYQLNCGNSEAWRLRLQRPINQSFTITIKIRTTCGGVLSYYRKRANMDTIIFI
jgi:hypothetical protein